MYIYLSATDTNQGLNVGDYFEPKAAKLVEDARKMCIGELTQKVMEEGLNAKNSLKSDIYKLLDDQMVHFRYNTLHVTPPVFIGIGTNDINVPTKMQVHFAEDVVSAGTSADVHEYKGMDHSETVNVSLRNSVPFVLGK
ncbi:hypothetical protein PEC302107_29750 [Pectobacterium araliae]|nr:hypothetical protein PEC302107_29750 [Pectobacterium carotovorum subsp. carotovorum]